MKFSVLVKHAQFHGARRLTDRDRCFWSIALVGLMLCCSGLVLVFILRYLDNPTHLVQHSIHTEVLPFAMVMICPEIMFPEHRINNFLNNIKYPDGMERNTVKKLLPQLAAFYAVDMNFNTHDLIRLQNLLNYNGIDLEDAVKKLTSSCEESIIRCQWKGVIVNCSTLFELEFTGTGLCCVFNGRSLRSEMKHGVSHKAPQDVWSSINNGHLSELVLVVNQTQVLDNIDLNYKWFVMQQSQSFVDSMLNGTALSPGTEYWFGFSIQGFMLTDFSKELSASLRKCHMPEEGHLLYFPVYTVTNCLLECEMALTMKHCGCIKITHPKIPKQTYCRAQNLTCSKRIIVSSRSEECECVQLCNTDILVEHSTFHTMFPNTNTFGPIYDNIRAFNNVSIVKVFPSSHIKKTSARQSVYNYLSLFAQVGGIFNVYFGCSVLTLLEFIMLCYHRLFG